MNTAGTVSHEEVQAFLDEVLALDIPKKYTDWYQVDVSAVWMTVKSRAMRWTNPLEIPSYS